MAKPVEILFLGNTAQLEASMASASATSDAMSSNFSKTMDSMTTKAGGAATRIGQRMESMGIPFGGTITKMGQGFDNLSTKGQKFGAIMKGIGVVSVIALAGIALEAVKTFDAFDVTQKAYLQSAKDAGESQKQAKATLDTSSKAMLNFGFNAQDTASSLNAFAIAGVTGRRATVDMTTAADLARAKNISLSDATNILVKTLAGSTRGLTALGLNLDVGSAKLAKARTDALALSNAQQALTYVQQQLADGSLKGAAGQHALQLAQEKVTVATANQHRDQTALASIMDAIKSKTQGQATAFGKTLAGQMDIAKATIHNTAIELGGKLAPAITTVVKIGGEVLQWLLKSKPLLIALGVVVGTVLVVAIGSWIAGLVASTAAGIAAAASAVAFGAAAVAAMLPVIIPIAAIVAAVVAVGVAIYELVTHWTTVWNAIKEVVSTAVGFIKNNWSTILEIITGPVGAIIFVWQHFHDQIIAFFKDIPGAVSGVIGSIVSFFEGAPGKILGVFADAGSWLLSVGSNILHGLWNGLQSAWGWLTGQIENLFKSSFIGKIAGWLGIHSPSTVFAGMGKNLMLGMAGGIAGNAAAVHSALADVASNVKVSGSAVVAAAAVAAPSPSSAAGGGGDLTVVLELDGTKIGTLLLPKILTAAYQQKRGTVKLRLD